jgi:hypothetical protein
MANQDYSSTDFFGSDNPPVGTTYDPFPDTSLGAEAYGPVESFGPFAPTQEQLGQQIITDTQLGLKQEELGRGIVQESLGRSILDGLLKAPDVIQPWFKGASGGLGETARLLSSVPGLYKTTTTPTQGGIPVQLGSQPYFGTSPNDSKVFSIFPSNTTRDGRSGTLQGGTARQVATLEVGGTDYLYIALGLVGAFFAFKAVRAFT